MLMLAFVQMKKYVHFLPWIYGFIKKDTRVMNYLIYLIIVWSFNWIGWEHKIFTSCDLEVWSRSLTVVWTSKAQYVVPVHSLTFIIIVSEIITTLKSFCHAGQSPGRPDRHWSLHRTTFFMWIKKTGIYSWSGQCNWGHLHDSPGQARAWLSSGCEWAGAFTSAIWTRHESEVSPHYRCRHIICLLHFKTRTLCSWQHMTYRWHSALIQSWAKHGLLPSQDGPV